MKTLKAFKSVLLFFCVVISSSVFAQPVNDDCSGAIQITQNIYPVYYWDDVAGATQSMPGHTNPAKDIWYSFTATDDILFIRLNSTAMWYEIFSGNCGNLTSIHEEQNLGGICADYPDSISVTPGQVYYIRVYYTQNITTPTFAISLFSRPLYDVCDYASSLVMSTDTIIDTLTFASMVYSRVSTQVPIPYMVNYTWGIDDIWFKFIATDTAHTVWLGTIPYINCWTNTFSYQYAKYKSCNPADTFYEDINASPIQFGVPGFVDFNSLVIGNTYYLRLWTNKMTGVAADFYAGVGSLGSTGQMPLPTNLLSPKKYTQKLIITPNPATSQLTIQMTGGHEPGSIIKIFDLTGRERFSGLYKNNMVINVSDYPTGIYSVQFGDKNGLVSDKFLKK